MGLRLGLGKSLFPVGRAKDQRLPAGPIATAFSIGHALVFSFTKLIVYHLHCTTLSKKL